MTYLRKANFFFFFLKRNCTIKPTGELGRVSCNMCKGNQIDGGFIGIQKADAESLKKLVRKWSH